MFNVTLQCREAHRWSPPNSIVLLMQTSDLTIITLGWKAYATHRTVWTIRGNVIEKSKISLVLRKLNWFVFMNWRIRKKWNRNNSQKSWLLTRWRPRMLPRPVGRLTLAAVVLSWRSRIRVCRMWHQKRGKEKKTIRKMAAVWIGFGWKTIFMS